MVAYLEFSTLDVGHAHVVGGRAELFQLFASENVNSNHVNLGVTVLSSLSIEGKRSAKMSQRRRRAFEVDMSTILQGRPLITTCPPLRRAEHCRGKVSAAPESAA
jgi:hypothetical protein